MKCPYCTSIDNKVVDSRMNKEGNSVRRRRECLECNRRFTTYERVEEIPVMLVKKDGRREPFDRNKVMLGLKKACEKRPVSINSIENFADELERELHDLEEKEVPSSFVGGRVMAKLHEFDPVAYVRFASVYREFKDVNDFVDELKSLLNGQKREDFEHPKE
ncbi:MAG: transcriptional regulator NrdR [Pseudomonadota bacterium]